MTPGPILEIKNLTKIYRNGRREETALNNVSLDVERGVFFGLLGPNGAGKSTLIHSVTGVTEPTSGAILIDGVDVVKDYKIARTKVGLSPQEFNVNIFNTPAQIMDYMAGYYGIPKATRKEKIDSLIKRFNLEKHRDVLFQKLSGGLKRRVLLGRALVHTPDLLILDEPTAGVDVEQRRGLWEYLKELNKSGKTIILTSHYLEEVQYLCNEIAIINHGKIVASGTKAEFMRDGKSLEEKYLEITKSNNNKNAL
ncbi:ABC transporter ATP-binding protein [Candidatus Kaiserbacteria bacterium]|nr:ABC transporter ATP-binding protein [Candidatus Kaiserbacteria bacterium]USN91918.1 MAG: ABC transporter ATP-binding protein [Candidatus Nomurabacteria bacterium]